MDQQKQGRAKFYTGRRGHMWMQEWSTAIYAAQLRHARVFSQPLEEQPGVRLASARVDLRLCSMV